MLFGVSSTIAQINIVVMRVEKRKTPARMSFLDMMLQSLIETAGGHKGWKAETKLGRSSLFETVKAHYVIRLLKVPKYQ